jgi:uncharacterized pyridoxamine 5'-phosphate oxidase family protein
MNKQEFLTYLPQYTSAILTTVREDGTPDGRGFEFQYEEDDRYYFGTANTKDVWKQLQAHPKAAFTYMEPTGKFTVRICGEIKVVTDPEEKKAAFDKFDPLVQSMYKSWDNPVVEVIYFEKPECRLAKGFGPAEAVE